MNGFLDDLGLKRYLPAAWTSHGPIIPVLRFSGAIGMSTPLRPGLTLSTSAGAIRFGATAGLVWAKACPTVIPAKTSTATRIPFSTDPPRAAYFIFP